MNSQTEKNKIGIFLFWLFIILGAAARVWRFGAIPGELNQDEAFAGYTAFSLLKYGVDTSGYAFPVYLTAWGSGMNALNTYLMIPFVALFGLKVWVIRLPQLIVAVLSLPALYSLVRRMFNERTALMALMLLALCPWHIMLSRWGLESNLAPGFLLFGLYFFVKAFDDPKLLMLSALMYGLSLYCYATVWPFVPFIILLEGIYAFWHKKLKFDRYLVFSVLILALLASPLLIFLAVNYGLLPEIKLPFFSVPKLLYMRSGEISFDNIWENFKNLCYILLKQRDGLPWNSTKFGLIYFITMPFCAIGFAAMAWSIIKNFGKFDFSVIVFIQLLAAVILGITVNVNVNRVNIIFIPMIIIAACGFELIFRLDKRLSGFVSAVYICWFLAFGLFYFNDYQDSVSYYFAEGLEETVEAVDDFDGTVYVTDRIFYPSLLFFSQEDVNVFLDTVKYNNYPAAFLSPSGFDNYVFFSEVPEPVRGCAYILPVGTDISRFTDAGFSAEAHGYFIVLK